MKKQDYLAPLPFLFYNLYHLIEHLSAKYASLTYQFFAHQSAHVERVRCSPTWLPGTQLKRLAMIGMTNHQGPTK
jgi:translation elongation factor EF-4